MLLTVIQLIQQADVVVLAALIEHIEHLLGLDNDAAYQ